MRRDQHHGIDVIARSDSNSIGSRPLRLIGLVIIPAGEDAGEADDDVLIVSGHHIAFGIEDQRAVRPHAVQADGEQLENLAGIIFVGMRAEGVSLPLSLRRMSR